MSNESAQSTRGFNVIFIHSSLDEAGLTPQQFRLLAHISRRAGDGTAWASNETMAKICRIEVKTVVTGLSVLEARKIIKRTPRPGKTTLWEVNPPHLWILDSGEVPEAPKVRPNPKGHLGGQTGYHLGGQTGYHLGGQTGYEGNPRKEIPERDPKAKAFETQRQLQELPAPLQKPEFLAKWHDWVADRKARNKRITVRAAELQLAKCAVWGCAKSIEAINTSISSGWIGLFEPKGQSGFTPRQPNRMVNNYNP